MGEANKAHLRREAMLEAVEELFAERGFGACSLRDVMSACGVSTTAFYARFESKEAILDELIQDLIDEIVAAATEALDEVRTIDEGFRAGVDALVATVVPRKGLVRVFLSEAATSEGVRENLRQSYHLLATLLHQRLERLDTPAPQARAWAIVGAVNMQVFRWAVLEDIADDELAPLLMQTSQTLIPSRE